MSPTKSGPGAGQIQPCARDALTSKRSTTSRSVKRALPVYRHKHLPTAVVHVLQGDENPGIELVARAFLEYQDAQYISRTQARDATENNGLRGRLLCVPPAGSRAQRFVQSEPILGDCLRGDAGLESHNINPGDHRFDAHPGFAVLVSKNSVVTNL